MQQDIKNFMKTLSTISATMASLSFLGVSIIMTKFYPTTNIYWKLLGVYGAISVIAFAFASYYSLVSLYPKSKDNERRLLYTIVAFGVGWASLLVLTLSLAVAFWI